MTNLEHLQAVPTDQPALLSDQGTSENIGTQQQSPDSSATPATSNPWMGYRAAAAYCGLSISYLRCLVSADAIPVYGPRRSRRFRRDMLDLYLTDREVAMRQFRRETEARHAE
ncbi:MAG: hypothetical protein M0R80_22310 [Proteobacteria bacterium]|jgi:excisionase family DNA binding protein|nr:hypothetical protein [Pseudomonadota bacterium]